MGWDRRAALKLGVIGALGLGTAAIDGTRSGQSRPVEAGGTVGQIEPGAGAWRTWLLSRGSQVRLPPPPDALAEIGEVRATMARRDAAALDRIAYWDAGSPAYRWNELLIDLLHVKNTVGNGPAFRALALLNVTLFDALVAAWDSKYTYSRPRPYEVDPALTPTVALAPSPAYPSEHAVTAGAAATILGHLFPREAEALRVQAEEAAWSQVQAGVQYPSDVRAGLELGRAVGAEAVAYAQRDGSDATWDGTIPSGPGLWTGSNPVGVADRYWKPWVLSSASQLRAAPPPAFGSPQLEAELAELKTFQRTPRTTGIALGWQYVAYGGSNFGPFWNRETSKRLFEERLDLNAPRSARAYALVHIALYDVWVATQDTKFHYWSIRPFQLDPTLTTVFPTPNHPSYVSNRAGHNPAAAAVLGYLFPRDAEWLQRTSDEISESALWAGIHFRSDITAAQEMARLYTARLLARARADGS